MIDRIKRVYHKILYPIILKKIHILYMIIINKKYIISKEK